MKVTTGESREPCNIKEILGKLHIYVHHKCMGVHANILQQIYHIYHTFTIDYDRLRPTNAKQPFVIKEIRHYQ